AGQWADALRFQTAAVALRTQSPGAHCQLGWMLLVGKGNVDEALVPIRRAVELAPRASHTQGSLAYALRKKGDFAAAFTAFRKALELNPKFTWAYYELGCAQGEHGDYAEAAGSLQKAIELSPNDAFLMYSLGIAHLAAGQRDAYRQVCA